MVVDSISHLHDAGQDYRQFRESVYGLANALKREGLTSLLLRELRERGYSVIGLDSEGAEPIETIPLSPPVALVLGAEGKGLRGRAGGPVKARESTIALLKSLKAAQ